MHRLLDEPDIAAYTPMLGTQAVKLAVHDVLADARRTLAGQAEPVPAYAALVGRIAERLARADAASLVPVLNATGILLHTNLGRAPLAREALDAIDAIGRGYSNLEFDLATGSRGSRYDRVTELLREVTGAGDALMVNNCAAAVLLVLDTYARDRAVVVARNELIEIGGGFRLPDVLHRSGATLIEVGTTNKVYLHDFERALSVDTALLLRSHTSNFRISGFVADVAPRDLSALGKRTGITTVEDLGTGALIGLERFGLPHERTVREAIDDGIDLVVFSGDKLLGGPQAGIIAGRPAAIARLRSNPLLRALRVDKATLAAMAATLRLYATPGGYERIPLYAMLAVQSAALRERAERLRASLGAAAAIAAVRDTLGYVGGGTLPDVTLPSAGLAIAPRTIDAAEVARRLRAGRPALIGRIDDGAFVIDMRTLAPYEDARVAALLVRALDGAS